MWPTLRDGETILAHPFTSQIKTGTIVIAKDPEEHGALLVKRVTKLEGDWVEWKKYNQTI